MHKNFNPIIDGSLQTFCEDVYLFDRHGNVIFCRQGIDRKIINIYDIVGKECMNFIKKNSVLSNINPIILLESIDGVIFFDVSLLNKKGIFVAIIPHFPKTRVLEIVKSKCSFVLADPKIQENLHSVKARELTREECIFADRLRMLHYFEIYYSQTHGKTNAEIADMMLDFAHGIASFIGCYVECNVRGISVFEIKNELCVYSYKFMLFILCFASRIYSEERKAIIDIYFDEMGVFMNLSFKLADVYDDMNIFELDAFDQLLRDAQNDKFLIEYEKNGDNISFCGYLWQHSSDYEHIKKKRIDLIYKMKGE